MRAKLVGLLLTSILPCVAASLTTARSVDDALSHMSIDPAATFHVRDLQLNRGGVKIYLTDGILAFAKPIEGQVSAAVFTTRGEEAGDAEVLAMPPNRSERASLAANIKRPNLNDHFGSAVFFFSDNTLKECLAQIHELAASRLDPSATEALRPALDPVLANTSPLFTLNLVQSFFDKHRSDQGFFDAAFGGRELGIFSFYYDPHSPEPVIFGRDEPGAKQQVAFKLWTSYRPARAEPYVFPRSPFSDYSMKSVIGRDLLLSSNVNFTYACSETDGRVLRLELSNRLHVSAATVDGTPAEVLQRQPTPTAGELDGTSAFLLVTGQVLAPGPHNVSVIYSGSVISRTSDSTYFVEERNTWYPYSGSMSTYFDLTFEFPETLRLVSTGELVSESVSHGSRTVRRKTIVPESLAGFNLGDYAMTSAQYGPYRVDIFSNRLEDRPPEDLASHMDSILADYTKRWLPLPFKSIAVSPISGYFGQGFPGLIYLSDVSYIRQKSRPSSLRTPLMDSFFSGVLLPHEVAHQWWGNLVSAADYRSAWFSEAMANHSALQYIAHLHGNRAKLAVLDQYRLDLVTEKNGKRVEESGPVDFGIRLFDSPGKDVWQTIIYEKGTWVLEMLEARLGAERWRRMQLQLLQQFTSRPLSNDEFRKLASAFVPNDQPDRDLKLFFDTWIYGTGVPELQLRKAGRNWELEVSHVPEDFTVDVPLSCSGRSSGQRLTWIRAIAGTNFLPRTENTQACTLPPVDQFLYTDRQPS